MRHLWVKLDPEVRLRVVCYGSEWCSACLSNDMKVGWNLVYLVTVRHPDLIAPVRKRTIWMDVVAHLDAPIELRK